MHQYKSTTENQTLLARVMFMSSNINPSSWMSGFELESLGFPL